MVELGEAEVLVGEMAQLIEGAVNVGVSGRYRFQEAAQCLLVDVLTP
jgi:hypothetical protein